MTINDDMELSVNRRRVMQLIAAGGAAPYLKGCSAEDVTENTNYTNMEGASAPSGQGYGSDPDLYNPVVTWEKTLSKDQLTMLRILGDIIIPADEEEERSIL